MSGSPNGYSMRLRSLLDRGAIGVLLLRGGAEVLFVGNDSYKPLLLSLSSVVSWVEEKIRDEYIRSAAARYGGDLSLEGLDVFSMCFSITGAKIVIATYRGHSLCCAFLGEEFSPSEILDVLRDIVESESKAGTGSAEDRLRSIKILILQARKNISMGNKEALLQNLADIKSLLDDLGDSTFRAYSDFLSRLSVSLERTELTKELETKLKRTLLLLLKGVSKRLEST